MLGFQFRLLMFNLDAYKWFGTANVLTRFIPFDQLLRIDSRLVRFAFNYLIPISPQNEVHLMVLKRNNY